MPSPGLFRGRLLAIPKMCQAPQSGACWGLCSLVPLIPEALGTATAQTRAQRTDEPRAEQPLSLQSTQSNLEAEMERGEEKGQHSQHSPWHCSEGSSWAGKGSERDEGSCAATLAEVLPCAQSGLSPSSGFAFSTS